MAEVIKPFLKYSPVVEFGIPEFSSDEEQLKWLELQADRCINGFQPEGLEPISGKYYFYLNFIKINRSPIPYDNYKGDSEKIIAFPLYRDIDHIVFDRIELQMQLKRDLMFGKRRRAGITEDMVASLIQELYFFPNNHVAYGLPTDELSSPFYDKFDTGWQNLPDIMRKRFLINNMDKKVVGYREVDESTKIETIKGTLSQILVKTFTRAGVMKGGWQRMIVLDEAGEFTDKVALPNCLLESRHVLIENGKRVGIIILLGTSNQVNNKSKGFQRIWENAKKYNVDLLFLTAAYWFEDEKTGEKFYDISTGKSDLEKATAYIKAKAAKLYDSDDKLEYYDFMNNHPLEPSHMWEFIQDGGESVINKDIVTDRYNRVLMTPELRREVRNIDLVWDVDDQNMQTGKVRAIPNINGKWMESLKPINHLFKGADILSIDDYLKNSAPSSLSKGAIFGWRRYIPDHNYVSLVPTIIYWARPKLRTLFFEDCVKTAIYTGAQVAIEYIDDEFFKYLKTNGYLNILKKHPLVMGKWVEKKDAAFYSIKDWSNKVSMAKIASWVESPTFQQVVHIELLKQLLEVGLTNTDIVSAFKVALLFDSDMENIPVEKIAVDKKSDEDKVPEFRWTMQGGRLVGTAPIGMDNDMPYRKNLQRYYGR